MAAPAAEFAGQRLATGEYAIPADSILLDPRIRITEWRPEDGDNGVFDAWVPLDLIAPDPAPVAADRVEVMRERLLSAHNKASRGSGVLDTILLCEIPGRDQLDIADGYHRRSAIEDLNQDLDVDYLATEIKCSIKPGCTPEDLLNLRIDSTSEHKKVSFARAALWILDFWRATPSWSRFLDATQAFGMTASKSSGEGFSGLTSSNAEAIKQWAHSLSRRLDLKPATIQRELAIASMSAPDLAVSVRPRTGGGRLEALTAQHMKIIATAFPHNRDETIQSNLTYNWDIQRAVARHVLEFNLPASKTRKLCELLEDCGSATEAEVRLADINPADLQVTRTGAGRPQQSQDTRGLVQELRWLKVDRLVDATALALAGLELAILKGRYVVPRIYDTEDPIFRLDVTEDERFSGVLAIRKHTGLADDIRSVSRRNRVQDLITGKFGEIDIVESGDFNTAVARVESSAEAGSLRYIDLSTGAILTNLLFKAVADEIRIRNGNANVDIGIADELSPNGIVNLSLEKVIGAFSTLSAANRTMIARHGIIGMEPIEIASITQNSIVKARRAIQATLIVLS